MYDKPEISLSTIVAVEVTNISKKYKCLLTTRAHLYFSFRNFFTKMDATDACLTCSIYDDAIMADHVDCLKRIEANDIKAVFCEKHLKLCVTSDAKACFEYIYFMRAKGINAMAVFEVLHVIHFKASDEESHLLDCKVCQDHASLTLDDFGKTFKDDGSYEVYAFFLLEAGASCEALKRFDPLNQDFLNEEKIMETLDIEREKAQMFKWIFTQSWKLYLQHFI
jgi:hypothetical protein